MFGLSSMNSGAAVIAPDRRASFCQSASDIVPPRMCDNGTWASALISRITISLRAISRLNITLVAPCRMLAARARSKPNVDLPIAGRAAMMIS